MSATPVPPPAGQLPPDESTAPAPSALLPGAGAPLVPGPPSSVRAPLDSRRVNGFFGISGVVGIVAVIVLVVIVAVVVLSLFRSH